MPPKSKVLPVRLTEEAYDLAQQLADRDGTSKARQVEIAIRERAERLGLHRRRPPAPTPDAPDA
jgi:hypothetical protein